MTQKALAAIQQTGPAAALEKCLALADQINAELSHRENEDPFAVAKLQAYLARANAVIKNCAVPKNTPVLRGKCSVSSDPSPLRLVLDAFLEAAMAAKQFGQKDKSGKHEQQEANLGQKEAGQEKEKESELSSMGEKSRKSSEELSQKRHSD
jgi:hypothetical protein